ncbi:MAG: hypothetical protein KY429_00595 [Actinobacteria bacterium]|nr:hypothetical protein [Actinomycetota bacterium]
MSELLIAIIAAIPGCLAALLAYLSRRSLRRSIGNPSSIPLTTVVKNLDTKVEKLVEGQTEIRERLARIEGELGIRLLIHGD